ncbi:hypothetical protein, partial ['Cynodon dactylon' phytoplasma]|uniref:hypothetical protein n=1 Tax='Cynodon dactylon' phytoplasma TaxID=295320 RepID=UPI001265BE19
MKRKNIFFYFLFLIILIINIIIFFAFLNISFFLFFEKKYFLSKFKYNFFSKKNYILPRLKVENYQENLELESDNKKNEIYRMSGSRIEDIIINNFFKKNSELNEKNINKIKLLHKNYEDIIINILSFILLDLHSKYSFYDFDSKQINDKEYILDCLTRYDILKTEKLPIFVSNIRKVNLRESSLTSEKNILAFVKNENLYKKYLKFKDKYSFSQFELVASDVFFYESDELNKLFDFFIFRISQNEEINRKNKEVLTQKRDQLTTTKQQLIALETEIQSLTTEINRKDKEETLINRKDALASKKQQ